MISHLALVVSDLQAAERYYRDLFDMELIGREAKMADGLWYTLPFEKNWEDARAAGIDLGMLALRRGRFVLALFKGAAVSGQVFVIGLRVPQDEISRIRARLTSEVAANIEDDSDGLEFRDAYQIVWQISETADFRTVGDSFNRWLEL